LLIHYLIQPLLIVMHSDIYFISVMQYLTDDLMTSIIEVLCIEKYIVCDDYYSMCDIDWLYDDRYSLLLLTI